MTQRRAFTLIEVSTVMVVVGVIAAVAGVSLSDQLRQAQSGAELASKNEDLQADYHRAREQMRGLRIEPTGDHIVVSHVRSCQSDSHVLESRQEALENGVIELVPPSGFCVEPTGEVLPLVQQQIGVDESGIETAVAVAASTSSLTTPLVVLRTQIGEGKRVVGLRLDRTGFSEAFRHDEPEGTQAFDPNHSNFEQYILDLGFSVPDIRAPAQTAGASPGSAAADDAFAGGAITGGDEGSTGGGSGPIPNEPPPIPCTTDCDPED